MDNLTHSLIGVSAGECFVASQPKIFAKIRPTVSGPLIIGTSIIANNFPDLDILMGKFFPAPYGYLLQHRGYTHTLVASLPQALLISLFIFIFSLIRKNKMPLKNFVWLSVIGVSGILLHIFADGWNSYGIHPFWPFNNKWYYGDAVFIAEPWIWLTLATATLSIAESLAARLFCASVMLLSFALPLYLKVAPANLLFAMAFWTGLLTLYMSRFSLKHKAYAGFFAFLFIVAGFVITSRLVKHELRDISWQLNAEGRRYDVVVNPLPVNFFCWSFIFIESSGKPETYKLTSGFFSALPRRYTPESCAVSGLRKNTEDSDFMTKKRRQDPRVVFSHPFKMPLETLKKTYFDDCRVRAFFQFARAPFMKKKDNKIFLGDYRFERPNSASFSRLVLNKEPVDCPKGLPPWLAPRRDLLK